MYIPRAACLMHDPLLVWSIFVADIGIATAYAAVPALAVVLWRLSLRVVEPPTGTLPLREAALWVLFIASCGLGHAIEAVQMWVAVPHFVAACNIATGAVSWWAVIATWRRRAVYAGFLRLGRVAREAPEVDWGTFRMTVEGIWRRRAHAAS